MAEIIRCESLGKDYRLGVTVVHALQDINCHFEAGEFSAIAGPSGSGKTTLLNLLGCLDKPNHGRLLLEGQDVTQQPLDRLARYRRTRLGFVFQTFNLVPVLSARENVEYPLLLSSVSSGDRNRRVSQILERVGLGERDRHRPNELSGGQRQRVAIARALITEPAVVLADEPTANLDSHTGEEIINLMRDLCLESGVTFIFSTHDARILGKADRILGLEDGRLTSNGQRHQPEACGEETHV
jgi:putative ABC transport system ATP-binding protein